MYKITIGIPVYNEESTILRVLDSLYIQKKELDGKFYIKCVVCFNGTTDNSILVVNNQKEKYKDLELIISDKGKSNAIFQIIERNQTSDFIIFIDSDVIMVDNCIENLLSDFDKNEKAYAITGNPKPINSKGYFRDCFSIRMRYKDYEKSINKDFNNKEYNKPYIHGRFFALKKIAFQKILQSQLKKSHSDDAYISHLLFYFFGRESIAFSKSAIIYYQPTYTFLGTMSKWFRIWSQIDYIYQLNPEFKKVKEQMTTKILYKEIIKNESIKVLFQFLIERLIMKIIKIIFILDITNHKNYKQYRIKETKEY